MVLDTKQLPLPLTILCDFCFRKCYALLNGTEQTVILKFKKGTGDLE